MFVVEVEVDVDVDVDVVSDGVVAVVLIQQFCCRRHNKKHGHTNRDAGETAD